MSWIIIANLLCGWVSGESCRQKFTHDPLFGFRCVTDTETYTHIMTMPHTCLHQCVSSGNCTIINYNVVNNTCLLSTDTCRLLQADPGFYVNTFRFAQHNQKCIRWVPSSDFDETLTFVIPVCVDTIIYGNKPCYLGRHTF